jgi:hypothetical protein
MMETGQSCSTTSSSLKLTPPRDPVLLWLTGGDLCTVFSGLVFEIGKQFWFEAMESFFLQVTIIEK